MYATIKKCILNRYCDGYILFVWGIMSLVYLLIVKLMFSQISACADTGSIVGFVLDPSETPLVGATVMIVGTSLGAMTDSFGFYEIDNIPIGNYNVKARMVGMGETTVEGVRVTSDKKVEHDFTLAEQYPSRRFYGILIRI